MNRFRIVAEMRKQLLILCVAIFFCAFAAKSAPPNVVVILADDQGWGDLSANGNTNLLTPNIDSLKRDGVTFDRFYVCAVCAPTRAEFLTGRYHLRGGVRGVSTGQERLNLDEKTFADSFKAAGYATGAFGKWHNGSQWPYHPNARGFDEFYGFTSGHWGEYFDPPLEHNGKLVRGKGYIADDLTDHALNFIEKNKSRPFVCYVPFNTPHSPWAVSEKFWKRFKNKPVGMRGADGDAENLDVTRCALAMVENLDWNVGRILDRLEKLRLSENTIVIYFSDNGPNSVRWNGGMKGRKGSVDEGGLRVPFFIRWPAKIDGGRTIPEIAGAIDLLPTLASLCAVSHVGQKPLDGMDLSPLLFRSKETLPERMIFSHQNGKVSVRSQRYRLSDKGALFDMTNDPSQTKNIANVEKDIAAKLTEAVASWRKEVSLNERLREKDERPFPVGYLEFPTTFLPARDGVPHGNVRRSANAPNCSYFVNWNHTSDSITWDIDVKTSGVYEVTLHYTCAISDVGSKIELSFKDETLIGKIAPAWDPPLYTKQDTIPRPPGESQMKEFRPLEVGEMRLEKGRGLLTLRALEIPGKNVMDLRQITLTLVK